MNIRKKLLDSCALLPLSNACAAFGRHERGEEIVQKADIVLPIGMKTAISSLTVLGGPKNGSGGHKG